MCLAIINISNGLFIAMLGTYTKQNYNFTSRNSFMGNYIL